MTTTRQPNLHPEQDAAWKKRNIAFANYSVAYRKQRELDLQDDLAKSTDDMNDEEKKEYNRKKAEALAYDKYRLADVWMKMDRKVGEKNDDIELNGQAKLAIHNITKLKEPGDYRLAGSNFGVRYQNNTIIPFEQRVNSSSHQHADPEFDPMSAIGSLMNFKKRYNQAFDFAATQCGASAVEIDFETPGRRSIAHTYKLLEMAERRQMEVELGPKLLEYLGTIKNAREVDALYERVRQVNEVAQARKKDIDYINRIEASMLEQYDKELKDPQHKSPVDVEGEPTSVEKLTKSLVKKEDDKEDGEPLIDESLDELERHMQGEKDKKTGDKLLTGFDERMKSLEEAEKELSTQLDALTENLNDESKQDEVERRSLGEGGAKETKQNMRASLITGLEDEAKDLQKREEGMSNALKVLKDKVSATPEATRTEEQKAQLQRIEKLEKDLVAKKKTLEKKTPSDGTKGSLEKLKDQDASVASKIVEWKEEKEREERRVRHS